MRQNKSSPPTSDKPILEEPVYVDEVFPDEEISQDDPWAQDEAVKELKLEATLEELLEEDNENEKDHPQAMPAKHPTAIPPARSYRVKISPPASPRTPKNQAYPQRPPLPDELPRPTRRNKPRDERTGTWPVEPSPRRNGVVSPKNLHPPVTPPPLDREPRPEKEHRHPGSGRIVPSQEQETPRETRQMNDFRPSPRGEPASKPVPPPVLPVMSITPVIPSRQELPTEEGIVPPPFPAQKPFNGSAFKPLVDEVSSTEVKEETDEHTSWDQVVPARSREGLNAYVERMQLPQNSLILGVCADGLPLVLEFSDPSTGALLFLGEDVASMQKHLQAILASVCLLSDPKQVQVDVISPDQDAFTKQMRFPHIQKVYLPDQEEVFELLGNLFELVEARQRKETSLTGKFLSGFLPANKGPTKILLIDQVDILVEQLAPESLAYLRWLLRRGPAANVWVLASLNSQNAHNIDGKTLKSFGLQIAGKLRNSRQTNRLTSIPFDNLSALEAGEACLQLNEETIQFSVLEV